MKVASYRKGQILFVAGVIAAQMIATWGFAASTTTKVDLYSDSIQVKNSENSVPKSFDSSAKDTVTITRSSAEMNASDEAPIESVKELKKSKKKHK